MCVHGRGCAVAHAHGRPMNGPFAIMHSVLAAVLGVLLAAHWAQAALVRGILPVAGYSTAQDIDLLTTD